MIEKWYSVNIQFLVLFDINLDVTFVVCWRTGFSTVAMVLLVFRLRIAEFQIAAKIVFIKIISANQKQFLPAKRAHY